MASDKLDHGLGSIAESVRVGGESGKLHNCGKGDDVAGTSCSCAGNSDVAHHMGRPCRVGTLMSEACWQRSRRLFKSPKVASRCLDHECAALTLVCEMSTYFQHLDLFWVILITLGAHQGNAGELEARLDKGPLDIFGICTEAAHACLGATKVLCQ